MNRTGKSLTPQTDTFRNRIPFDNTIMTKRMNTKVKQHPRFNLKVRHKNSTFDILKKIIEYVTLFQLMDSLGNVNHAINIVEYWIFESNYEKAIFPTK